MKFVAITLLRWQKLFQLVKEHLKRAENLFFIRFLLQKLRANLIFTETLAKKSERKMLKLNVGQRWTILMIPIFKANSLQASSFYEFCVEKVYFLCYRVERNHKFSPILNKCGVPFCSILVFKNHWKQPHWLLNREYRPYWLRFSILKFLGRNAVFCMKVQRSLVQASN